MSDTGQEVYEEYVDWYATCDHMPGPAQDRELRVGGTIMCPESDWSAELGPSEGNTGINERILHLNLVVTPPPPNKIVRPVVTPVPVDWRAAPPAFEYEEVEFHRADSAPPPKMKVDHTE